MARRGEGQTALVTGASAGIGVELAECFAKDGYDVIVTARSEGPLKELAGRLARQHNVQAVAIAADIGQPGGGEKLARFSTARRGRNGTNPARRRLSKPVTTTRLLRWNAR